MIGRRSIRLRGFDYSQPGAYFLTICSAERKCTFGSIENGRVVESGLGKVIRACWIAVPQHFPSTEIDAFVIMPNHLHAILNIKKKPAGSDGHSRENFAAPTIASVPTIVRTFKAAVARRVRETDTSISGPIWQRDYHERIIRDGKEYAETCRYIGLNPIRWELDENHPTALEHL